jgi:hypothetical protein
LIDLTTKIAKRSEMLAEASPANVHSQTAMEDSIQRIPAVKKM